MSVNVNITTSTVRPSSQYGGFGFLGTVSLLSAPNQSASLPSTPWFSTPKTEAGMWGGGGMYCVFADVLVTQAASAGTMTINVAWNNGTTNASLNSSALNLTSLGEQAALLGNFMAAEGTTISVSTTFSGVTGNPLYTLSLRLVYIG